MERLTHERCNGIKTGCWSPEKKQVLVDALAAYEDTGLTPQEIMELKARDTAKAPVWKEGFYGGNHCGNCGEFLKGYTSKWKFCPICGRRIDEKGIRHGEG